MMSAIMLGAGHIQGVAVDAGKLTSCQNWETSSASKSQPNMFVGIGGGGSANPSNSSIYNLKVDLQKRKKIHNFRKKMHNFRICASSTGGKELYQPFRPPPTFVSTVLSGTKTVEEQLELLRERQGLWYMYAKVIPSLTRAGFTPSEIDEATGLNGHEQNELVVGAQVRDSLIDTGFPKDALGWFDVGGADRLYELRTLSVTERKAAAQFVIDRNMDAKLVRDLARSVKDFPRRKNVEGFSSFTTAPGDCLAFALYRQSKETSNATEMEGILNRALEFAVTEKAKAKIRSALGQGEEEATAEPDYATIKVLVMRLSSQKVPVVLPVADFSAEAVEEVPFIRAVTSGSSGSFNIVRTEIPWKSWIAIPSWRPISYARAPVALLVPDGSFLPKQTGIKLSKDPILLVVDKGDKEIVQDSFFIVSTEGPLTLQLGHTISSSETIVGKVLIALKPPLPEDPNNDTDWD